MKSQLSETSPIKTSCKECVFAVYEGDTQTGCEFNRLDKLPHFEAYDDQKEFYVVKGLCNHIRHEKTKDGSVYDKSLIHKEVALSFYILLDIENLSEQDVRNINWEYDYKDLVGVHIFAPPEKLYEARKIYDSKIYPYASLVTVSDIRDHEKFKKLSKQKNSFVLELNNSNQRLDLKKINDSYNKECLQASCFKYKDVLYVSNLAYTAIGNKTGCTSHDQNIKDVLDFCKEKETVLELKD